MAITLKKISGDTEVLANPTLDGSETALSGLQIDGVKYAMGGGKIYQHLITLYYNASGSGFVRDIRIVIFNNSNEKFTYDSLLTWLEDKGHWLSDSKEYPATGYAKGVTDYLDTYFSVWGVYSYYGIEIGIRTNSNHTISITGSSMKNYGAIIDVVREL